MNDPELTAPEVVHVQLQNDDGSKFTDVPFSRKEFERLKSEAAAAGMAVDEYIKQKIEKKVATDRTRILTDLINRLRNYDEDTFEGTPSGVNTRVVLEAIVLDWADEDDDGIDIDIVEGYDDAMLASVAFSFACIVGADARAAKSLRARLSTAEIELAEKTAVLRSINREAQTERLETRLAEARAAERATVGSELETLRATVARQQSEINDLRAAKKKLREALERMKEGR